MRHLRSTSGGRKIPSASVSAIPVDEIGIRMALGARPSQVLTQVLLGGMPLVSMGVAAGVLGALWATSLLRTLLFGVSSRDPVIYGSVVMGMIGVGLLANFLPARCAA